MEYELILSGFIIALSINLIIKSILYRNKTTERELYSLDININKSTEIVLHKYNIKNRDDLINFDRTVLIKDIKNISQTHWNTLKYPESAIRKKYCHILPGYKNYIRTINE